jgi:hypothetical protein
MVILINCPHLTTCKPATKPLKNMHLSFAFRAPSFPPLFSPSLPFPSLPSVTQVILISPWNVLWLMFYHSCFTWGSLLWLLIQLISVIKIAFNNYFARLLQRLSYRETISIYKQSVKRNLWFNIRTHESLGTLSILWEYLCDATKETKNWTGFGL